MVLDTSFVVGVTVGCIVLVVCLYHLVKCTRRLFKMSGRPSGRTSLKNKINKALASGARGEEVMV